MANGNLAVSHGPAGEHDVWLGLSLYCKHVGAGGCSGGSMDPRPLLRTGSTPVCTVASLRRAEQRFRLGGARKFMAGLAEGCN